ncbi:MAG: hypothetical protein J07HQW1_01095 [Haloquadratum walsbyi J07HQW1]|uniref:PAS sensor histidine kinase n=1 Tax=Haloquadratum walsbyi J07HQW1 TaxID=1238424 RepID=U1N3V2_9EURY|nr:MAG: hypothetical protein J07HQW1_01095 [Haloquadratum walsbyi J07HQW1]
MYAESESESESDFNFDSDSPSLLETHSTEIAAIGFEYLCTPAAVIDTNTGDIATLNRAFAELLTDSSDTQDTVASKKNSAVISKHSDRTIQSVWDTSTADSFDSLTETLTAVGESQTQKTGDLALAPIGADNKTRWLSATFCPIQSSDQFILLTGEEITDVKQQYSDAGHVVEIFNQPTTTHDPETGVVRSVNEAFTDLSGYDAEAVDNESLIETLAASPPTAEAAAGSEADSDSFDTVTHTSESELSLSLTRTLISNPLLSRLAPNGIQVITSGRLKPQMEQHDGSQRISGPVKTMMVDVSIRSHAISRLESNRKSNLIK